MRDHIRILGILNIVMGTLTSLLGVVAMLAMGTIASFIEASLPSAGGSDYHDAVVAAPVVASIGFGIAIFFFVLGLPSIIGGWGLMNYRPWSRILMIIVSIFHLFHVPLGTALGVYGLWVLLSADGQRLLESGGMYPPAAPGYGSPSYVNPPNYGPPPGAPRA
jgi:hypothetical protein